MPKEDSDNEDVVSADGDQSDEIKENSVDDNDLGRNLSLFDQRRLAERIDPEKGVKAQEFAKLVKTDDLNLEESNHEKKEECLEDEFAIIGYWKQSQNVFSCYHFFYVPTPMKRAIKDDGQTVLYQLLYTGLKNEIFFFFKQKT